MFGRQKGVMRRACFQAMRNDDDVYYHIGDDFRFDGKLRTSFHETQCQQLIAEGVPDSFDDNYRRCIRLEMLECRGDIKCPCLTSNAIESDIAR